MKVRTRPVTSSGLGTRRWFAGAAALLTMTVVACGGSPAAAPSDPGTSAATSSMVAPATSDVAVPSTSIPAPPTTAPPTTPPTDAAPSSDPNSDPPSSSAEPAADPSTEAVAPDPGRPQVGTPFSVQPVLPVNGPVLARSVPVSLSIPAIGVESSLLDLGLNPDGTVEVPSLDDPSAEAGWYTGSPTPGERGPSVILGHIDSRKYGPGIFYDLDKLQAGDEVSVTREDGSVATFVIDKVESYLKSEFPTDEIYGNIDSAGLRLITCGGVFNTSESSYESNIIAFGSLKA